MDRKMIALQQSDVNYTPDYEGTDGRCASCRWFKAYDNECQIVESYPVAILPTGRCDRHEMAPTDENVDVAMASADGKITPANPIQKAWQSVRNLFTDDTPLTEGFKVNGNHWLAVWTNNFEDRDKEFFPAKALDDYVYRVDTGLVPPPELWVYHANGTKLGSADWVGRDGHFMFAAGTFDDNPNAQTAKVYYKIHADQTSLSHGFEYDRTQFIDRQYHQFNTFEITLLPRGAEANRYTSLEGVKAMTLSDKKRAYLERVFGKEATEEILADYQKAGESLEELGKAYKEFQTDPQDAPETDAVTQAAKDADENFSELLSDLIGEHAEVIEVAAASAKEINTLRGTIQAQDKAHNETLAAMRAELDALRDEMALRPRSASTAKETVVPEDGKLSDAVREDVKRQTVRKDEMWGTEVSDMEEN